jgi:hypothetical protein
MGWSHPASWMGEIHSHERAASTTTAAATTTTTTAAPTATTASTAAPATPAAHSCLGQALGDKVGEGLSRGDIADGHVERLGVRLLVELLGLLCAGGWRWGGGVVWVVRGDVVERDA